jgi:UDP-N-acetylglucosamine--N-acetylmuramyl-(pentapeptide) pyrophosphoryl-undecaprenol N-acetylglucosamine transferase
VPEAGFPIEWIEIGGLKRLGVIRRARTLIQIPVSVARARAIIRRIKPGAVFSMGGYVAGPVVLASALGRIPIVAMEPNAVPGATNRYAARWVARALLNFEETAKWFPPGRTEVTGMPVRREFFDQAVKAPGGPITVLITGGSQGSQNLNRATRESWPFFRSAAFTVRLIHQTGPAQHAEIAADFAKTGLDGDVVPFIQDMPGAFARSDVVICRSGAGAVAELAAAGKPAILVPFPFATDNHQQKNAEALLRAGAARMVLDRDMNGARLFDQVAAMAAQPAELQRMANAVRQFAKPNAAARAAAILEEVACR